VSPVHARAEEKREERAVARSKTRRETGRRLLSIGADERFMRCAPHRVKQRASRGSSRGSAASGYEKLYDKTRRAVSTN
jgi:hypothetical protein